MKKEEIKESFDHKVLTLNIKAPTILVIIYMIFITCVLIWGFISIYNIDKEKAIMMIIGASFVTSLFPLAIILCCVLPPFKKRKKLLQEAEKYQLFEATISKFIDCGIGKVILLVNFIDSNRKRKEKETKVYPKIKIFSDQMYSEYDDSDSKAMIGYNPESDEIILIKKI